MKRISALLLCLVIALAVVPTALPVFADDGTASKDGSEPAATTAPEGGESSAATAKVSIPDAGSERYYLDLGDVLSPELEQQIVTKNKAIKDKAEIVVVTVKTVGDVPVEGKETPAEVFAGKLFDKWEIGGKEKRQGVLLLMDIEGETYFSIAGEGVSSAFSGEVLDKLLLNYVEADFAAKNYDTAVQKFVENVEKTINGEQVVSGLESTSGSEVSKAAASPGGIGDAIWGFFKALLIILAVVLVLAVILVIIMNIRNQKRRKQRRRSGSRPSSSTRRSSGDSHTSGSSRPVRRSGTESSRKIENRDDDTWQ